MKKMMTVATLLLLTLSAAAQTVSSPASPPPQPSASPSIADMAWLAGHWTGTGLGGRCEETWTAPDAGVMVGTFRLIKDEKTVFYEFLTLSVIAGRIVMRLKHFNPDMTGWEEKEKFVEFTHTGTEGNVFDFGALRFVRESADRLTILLKLRSKDGSVREEKFAMRRR